MASRRRVTYAQLEQLWKILDRHRDLATGYNKTAQAREFSKRMWKMVSNTLNSQGGGAIKDWKGWCKYWNDYKSKLKKTAAAVRVSRQRTGGSSQVKDMTEIEKKFLNLLSEDFGLGIPGAKVEPIFEEFHDTQQSTAREETPPCRPHKRTITQSDIESEADTSQLAKKVKEKYSAYGEHIAEKLRSMPNDMAVICQKIINDALFMGDTGYLDMTCRIIKTIQR